MRFKIIDAHRLERAGTDMQRDVADGYATRGDALEKSLVKVQASRRRRHGARDAREHRLIAVAIGVRWGAIDVGRQWHLAMAIEKRQCLLG